ncbi:cysteine--tRNA ligase [Pararhizobium sp. LjRoot238]|uniref:cysteine--tRNA ligase n=1 Tax=Pararhizobium sp. LjRoot238 TaxID=3342293 RepID=UPI003F50A5FF
MRNGRFGMGGLPTLKLYNTLTREKAVFTPIDPTNVGMYVCGPTVYDYAHIGNARPVIVFDVLYRLLKHLAKEGVWDGGKGETKVTYVRNITDVDDKINARALRDFPDLPLNDAIRAVTEKTETQFLEDAKALGCLDPDEQPRATDNIQQMIIIIEKLIAKGHAYQAEGEVLFDTRSMADYGRLSNRNLGDQQAGARVAVDAHKKNPGDFVLWKLSSESEPGWDSPWGRGRPGWHIECSAMSERYLGETFDIHGGGLDLIFPHHENEIAQSRCAHGTDVMANVWMHNGFLQVEGRKMSKSEGNFVTIYELLHTEKFGGRKWPGEVLRLAMLMTHYRQPIDFSLKRLEEAENILQSWVDARKIASDHNWVAVANRLVEPVPSNDLVESLADDLNMSEAITLLQRWSKEAARGDVDAAFNLLNGVAFLGVELEGFMAQAHVDKIELILIQEQIEIRLELLKAKNFPEADKIREDLATKGIQLKDGKDAATGERVTTWEVKR